MWQVEFTDEFGGWWEDLTEMEQDAIAASVRLLQELGPGLPRPHSDTVKGSRHANMKKLAVSAADGRFAHFTRLILVDAPSCLSVATRREMTGFMNR